MNLTTRFSKGQAPWNKGKKGSQVPWNKGLTRETDSRVKAPWEGKKRPNFPLGIPHLKARGANHYKWIENRTELKRDTGKNERGCSLYREWRAQVWLRDSYKCKIANPDCNGRIEAHHILGWREYPELRYQTNNGITLCHAHHPRKRAEEKRLSPYFQSLVSVSKE